MTDTGGTPIWFLRKCGIFEDQTESMYDSVGAKATAIEFKRGDILSPVTETRRFIIVILQGQVKLRSLMDSGKEIILDIVGPGDAFGPLEGAVKSTTDTAGNLGGFASEAVALSKGSALRLDQTYFNDLVQRRPTLVVNLTRILGMRQKRLEVRLARLLYHSSLGKVAGLLSELGQRYGIKKDGTIHIDLRLTHQEMASIVGLKRETVTEALAELEGQGLITAARAAIVLLKPEELESIP